MKKNNKKGFTLAELLIVVAIIAVLVAISIPVFTKRLEASRETTDLANLRSAYAAAEVALLSEPKSIKNATMQYKPDDPIGMVTDGGTVMGKGTKVDGGVDCTNLPSGITYDNTTAAQDKRITIKFDAKGTAATKVESIQFG